MRPYMPEGEHSVDHMAEKRKNCHSNKMGDQFLWTGA